MILRDAPQPASCNSKRSSTLMKLVRARPATARKAIRVPEEVYSRLISKGIPACQSVLSKLSETDPKH